MSEYTFADLQADFDRNMTTFKAEMAAFCWEDKDCYAKWCAHTYFYVSHSTRLLAMAAGRCEVSEQTFHKRFLDHLQEEKGHEKLAIGDLKKLGHKVDDFVEMPETSLFYQNQYYWLGFHGAMPFFGWILALEGGAVHTCSTAYARVVKAHGAGAGLFLKVHAEEDIGHLEKALHQVKDLPSPVLRLIAKNLEQSSELYWGVLRRITAGKFKSENAKVA